MTHNLPKRLRKNLKLNFPFFGSQEIGSTLVSFQMIFEALQSELFRKVSFTEFENPKNNGIQPR